MSKPSADVVLITLSTPLLVGVYVDCKLVKSFCQESKSSDSLPSIFEEILQKYEIIRVLYARGPGSFMAIKMAYVACKTLEITKGIELLSQSGFYFNNCSPIRAHRGSYFISKSALTDENLNVEIVCESEIEDRVLNIEPFSLPSVLRVNDFSKECEPLYILPAL